MCSIATITGMYIQNLSDQSVVNDTNKPIDNQPTPNLADKQATKQNYTGSLKIPTVTNLTITKKSMLKWYIEHNNKRFKPVP